MSRAQDLVAIAEELVRAELELQVELSRRGLPNPPPAAANLTQDVRLMRTNITGLRMRLRQQAGQVDADHDAELKALRQRLGGP